MVGHSDVCGDDGAAREDLRFRLAGCIGGSRFELCGAIRDAIVRIAFLDVLDGTEGPAARIGKGLCLALGFCYCRGQCLFI